jgi:hypothetical protein
MRHSLLTLLRRKGGSPFSVLTITNAGGFARLTLAAAPPAPPANGSYIVVSGNSVSGYNVVHQVSATSGATITTTTAYTSDGTSGTWMSVTPHSQTYTTNATITEADRVAWVGNVKLAPTGSGGDGTTELGGGGGGYAEATLLASSISGDLAIHAGMLGSSAGFSGDDGDFTVGATQGAGGLDGGAYGYGYVHDGTSGVVISSNVHNGGNGTADGGGSPGTASADGTDGASDGTAPGSGGNPPSGTGVGGQVVVSWNTP